MRAKEDIKETLLSNLSDWYIDLSIEIEKNLAGFKSAETVERIMFLKQSLLKEYIKKIPLGAGLCYFCLELAAETFCNCDSCPYGKVHGKCDEPKSDWSVLRGLQRMMLDWTERHYYKGELYGCE